MELLKNKKLQAAVNKVIRENPSKVERLKKDYVNSLLWIYDTIRLEYFNGNNNAAFLYDEIIQMREMLKRRGIYQKGL